MNICLFQEIWTIVNDDAVVIDNLQRILKKALDDDDW